MLRYWSGGECVFCFYCNYGKFFLEQLVFGICYFDIDICYGVKEVLNCYCGFFFVCCYFGFSKDGFYFGIIEKGFIEIDSWLVINF